MTTQLVEMHNVEAGYPWSISITLAHQDGTEYDFGESPDFRAHIRKKRGDAELLAELTTSGGHIAATGGTITVTIPAQATADLAPLIGTTGRYPDRAEVLMDIAREDVTPHQHLGIVMELVVTMPLTLNPDVTYPEAAP